LKRLGLIAGVLACLVVAATPAAAHERYFTRVNDWFTPQKNEKELELYWTQEKGGNVEGQLEFEYGVTSRYTVAPYLLFSREHGDKYDFTGLKLEQRYRFGNYAQNRILPALYLEVEKEESEPYKLEGKLITSYLFGDRYIWSNNFIFEGEVEDSAKVEFGYASGLNYTINRNWQAGVELFGNWTEDEHFFGPTIGYRFNQTTKVLLNAGFKYLGEEGGSVRLFFEKEWR
jgi:hypothetical protein